jgi:hypothetical protein
LGQFGKVPSNQSPDERDVDDGYVSHTKVGPF